MENIFKRMHHLISKKNRNLIPHLHIIQVIDYFYKPFSIFFRHIFFFFAFIQKDFLFTYCVLITVPSAGDFNPSKKTEIKGTIHDEWPR